MTKQFRWTILMALLIAVGAALPSQAAANTSCGDAYDRCLNDSYDTSGWRRTMADLECGARWARCIKDILMI